jgi:hypothetical protein
VKLVAYQAWLAMQQRGTTIDIVGLNIGAAPNMGLTPSRLASRSVVLYCVDPFANITVNMTGFDTDTVNITFAPDITHDVLESVTLLVEFEAINLAIGMLTGQYLKNGIVSYYDQNTTFIWFTGKTYRWNHPQCD